MRAELAIKIENAFSNVAYPGDHNIGDGYLRDFVGQNEWKKIPLELLFHNESGIPLFTPQAFHFYLPAFLRALLLYPEAERMLDFVISSLTPSSMPDVKWIVEHSIGLFSNLEKTVVLEFLQKHQEFFPKSEYVLFDEDRLELQRAIQYWEKNQ
jgi:hypothetical protein